MKTKETSTTRQQAIAWWKNLSPYDEQHSLREKYFGYERLTSSLTGREIEEIWLKETQTICDESPEEFLKNNPKPNQKQFPSFKFCKEQKEKAVNAKQFKQFDESLFRAYIDKFSNEDKLKMLAKLSCEISTVNPILNDLLNRISCYGGNK